MSKKSIYVWGTHSIAQMLATNPQDVLEIWFRDGAQSPSLDRIKQRCGALGVTAQPASIQALDRMSDGALHQGVVAKRLLPNLFELESLIEQFAAKQAPPLLLALDKVQDPQNFGACLRVADAAGVDAVITLKDGAAPLTGAVCKAASGAMDTVPIVICTNLARAFRTLKAAGIWIIGTADTAPIAYFEADYRSPSCLVVGAEGRGLRQLTAAHCDLQVAIPMQGAVDSLNVATATAVCLFEASRQRTAGTGT